MDLEPGSLNSLKAYLGSGAIRGIGPKMAQYMVDGLGKDVLKVLDDQFAVEALMRCKKIGRVMAEKIKEGWEESRSEPCSPAALEPCARCERVCT